MNAPGVPDHELISKIGQGSYGEVWLARATTGAYRAVKVVYRARFEEDRPYEREFNGLLKFEPISRTNPNQMAILHVGRNHAGGFFYSVMELADDQQSGQEVIPTSYRPRTLKSDLRARGRLPVAECVRLGLQLAEALEHLHGAGLVHRDVKPSNIVFHHGLAKLADIGLVTTVDEQATYVGTEGYLPLEGAGTPSADVYALGKVLYEACTGQDRLDYPELPTALREFPDAPALLRLNQVLIRACDEHRGGRFPTVREFAAALRQVESPNCPPRRRLPGRKTLLVAAAVLTLAGGLAFWPRRLGGNWRNDGYYRRTCMDWPMVERDPAATRFVPGASQRSSITNWGVGWRLDGVRTALIGNVREEPGLEVVVQRDAGISIHSSRGQLLSELPPAALGCLHDMDGDGRQEVITFEERERELGVRVMGGDGGTRHTASLAQARGDLLAGPVGVFDVDGDGQAEIVCVINSAATWEALDAAHGRRGLTVFKAPWEKAQARSWSTDIGPVTGDVRPWHTPVRVAAVVAGGFPRLLHGSSGPANGHRGLDGSVDGASYAFCYHSANGSQLWRRPFDGLYQPGFFDTVVFLPDLNGDGVAEVVVTTSRHGRTLWENRNHGAVHWLDPVSGADRKVVDLRQRNEAGVCGDLDGDGKDELVLEAWTSEAGSLRVFGERLEEKARFVQAGGRCTPFAICDLDGDGKRELVALFRVLEGERERVRLLILNQTLDRILWQREIGEGPLGNIMVVDLEGDGHRQIVVVCGGRLLVLQTRP